MGLGWLRSASYPSSHDASPYMEIRRGLWPHDYRCRVLYCLARRDPSCVGLWWGVDGMAAVLVDTMTLPADRKIPYRAILFWGDTSDQKDYYKEVAPFREPKDYVRNDVPRFRRESVAEFLDSGEQILGYMGYADCRICGDTLGTRDMGTPTGHLPGGLGLVWPEMASHYIRKHNVWVPEHQELWCKLTWKINL